MPVASSVGDFVAGLRAARARGGGGGSAIAPAGPAAIIIFFELPPDGVST